MKKSLENQLADQKSPERKGSLRETTINGTIVNSELPSDVMPIKENVPTETFIGNDSGNNEGRVCDEFIV